jgi:predicted transcriptional regulator
MRLKKAEILILKALKEAGKPLSMEKLAELTGYSYKKMIKYNYYLERRGLIKRYRFRMKKVSEITEKGMGVAI